MTMQKPAARGIAALEEASAVGQDEWPAPDEAVVRHAAADLFQALSDPTRLTILQHLSTGEHRVRELTEHLGLAQSTVSTHLAALRGCGLVTSRPVGRASVFSLTAAPALFALLGAADGVLEVTGRPSGLWRAGRDGGS